ALPDSLQKACAALQLKDPLKLKTRITIDTPVEGDRPPVLFWDGWLSMHDATVHAGIQLDHVSGQLACVGLWNGEHLESVEGNIFLREATLFNQPLHELHSQILVTKDSPDVLRLPGLHARYCGGEVYGPVRVEFGP